jgi:hypothetical protein
MTSKADAIWMQQHDERIRAEQREKDAQIAEDFHHPWSVLGSPEFDWDRVLASSPAQMAQDIAAAIRAGASE